MKVVGRLASRTLSLCWGVGGGGRCKYGAGGVKAVLAPAATAGGADSCQAPGRETVTALSMNAIVQTMGSFYIVNTIQYYQILQP